MEKDFFNPWEIYDTSGSIYRSTREQYTKHYENILIEDNVVFQLCNGTFTYCVFINNTHMGYSNTLGTITHDTILKELTTSKYYKNYTVNDDVW